MARESDISENVQKFWFWLSSSIFYLHKTSFWDQILFSPMYIKKTGSSSIKKSNMKSNRYNKENCRHFLQNCYDENYRLDLTNMFLWENSENRT